MGSTHHLNRALHQPKSPNENKKNKYLGLLLFVLAAATYFFWPHKQEKHPQPEVIVAMTDDEFVQKIYENPEILQEFWALGKALEILNRLPEGEQKEALRDFLCNRYPDLWICDGKYNLAADKLYKLVEAGEEFSPDILQKISALNTAFEVAWAEYESDPTVEGEATLIQKILELEEEAEKILEEHARDKGRTVELLDPNKNPEEELLSIAGKLLDLLARAEALQKARKAKTITPAEFVDGLQVLNSQIQPLMRKFIDIVKSHYKLPEEVFEKGKFKAFKATWAKILAREMNGHKVFVKAKTAILIYYRIWGELAKVFREPGLWAKPSEVEQARKPKKQ